MDTKTIKRYLAKRYWLDAHFGTLNEIAEEAGVSRQHVQMVFWGKKKAARIVAALKKHGAPMFDEEPMAGAKSVKITA
jgi:predicted transcriptional regulator